MMKLEDYLQCLNIRQLHADMGVLEIPELPALPPFEMEVVEHIVHEEPDPKEVEFNRELKTRSIQVDKFDFQIKPNELLEDSDGRKMSAYIRDQSHINYGPPITTEYRYHLCTCQTIQTMKKNGRENRYLKTKRDDGFFEVYDKNTKPPRKAMILEMSLCSHCIEILKNKGIYSYPFNLKKYFEENDTYILKTIRRIETVTKVQTYTPNQEDLSRAYKEKVRFQCQECNVNCSDKSSLLHLHHINGDPSDNSRSNLQVLCVACHARKPFHAHMLKNNTYKKHIELIKKMREEQGILMIN